MILRSPYLFFERLLADELDWQGNQQYVWSELPHLQHLALCSCSNLHYFGGAQI